MSNGYWVCVYEEINNIDKLKEYAVKATEAIKKYSGEFLVRGGQYICFEGKDFPRTVIIKFKNFENANKCHESPEYKEALDILKGHVNRNLQIVEGA